MQRMAYLQTITLIEKNVNIWLFTLIDKQSSNNVMCFVEVIKTCFEISNMFIYLFKLRITFIWRWCNVCIILFQKVSIRHHCKFSFLLSSLFINRHRFSKVINLMWKNQRDILSCKWMFAKDVTTRFCKYLSSQWVAHKSADPNQLHS